VEVAV